ncbi:hypothetical protein PUNSTDRAFT_55278 [Punctularia strigosozonata HHB-11173 SS5]|uniref:Uncharacterized protein n=1 Tax=Punctularia strigosozonata (strain HHB-11173) TaxID=741275 RepID=R7S4Z9_PUNST|nr:uncharacterized protein PUNSTDRAFT_55278 [Punctularia strigosozonata HHB-11173 SS5]EIN04969.1 hypothetical protein PUNSTDRAFT_55278 [Punctularia strigosozonata HHB-11173 SS5]
MAAYQSVRNGYVDMDSTLSWPTGGGSNGWACCSGEFCSTRNPSHTISKLIDDTSTFRS